MPGVDEGDTSKLESKPAVKNWSKMKADELLKLFETVIFQLQQDSSKNGNVVKIVSELSKLTDLGIFEEHHNSVLDLQWLMMESPSTNTLTWNVLSLLTKLCCQSVPLRHLMRDKFGTVATLTQLLLRVPPANSAKAADVLIPIKIIVQGIRIDRIQSFLFDLIPKLIGYVFDHDPVLMGGSLVVLSHLCRGNYIVKKMLLAQLNKEQRKTLLATNFSDKKIQVLVNMLNFFLSRENLNAQHKFFDNPDTFLMEACDAIILFYDEKDLSSMRSLIDFVCDWITAFRLNTEDKDAVVFNVVQLLQHIFICADFSEAAHNESNELLFLLASKLLILEDDVCALIEAVIRPVYVRLESLVAGSFAASGAATAISRSTTTTTTTTGASTCSSAGTIRLFHELLKKVGTDLDTSTLQQNVLAQVDQVVQLLCEVVANESIQVSKEMMQATLGVLTLLSKIDMWAHLVLKNLTKPSNIIDRIKGFCAIHRQSCCAPIFVQLFWLGHAMANRNASWQTIIVVFLAESDVMASLKSCLRNNCHTEASNSILKAIATLNIDDEIEEEQDNAAQLVDQEPPYFMDNERRLDELLDTCVKTLHKMDLDLVMHSTLELHEMKMSCHARHVQTLKKSLGLADKEITEKNTRIHSLENEAQRSWMLIKKLRMLENAAQQELKDVRLHYKYFQAEADASMSQLNQQLQACQSEKTVLVEERDHLLLKVAKYKEQNDAMHEAIKEHQQVQLELKDKLMQEVKINGELTMSLSKREDKLKKKERQWEEAVMERERLEKEMDSMKKENASLTSLNKRLEQALAKKEKQLQENAQELSEARLLQEQIFNWSRKRKEQNNE